MRHGLSVPLHTRGEAACLYTGLAHAGASPLATPPDPAPKPAHQQYKSGL
ncbi:hypothetical protein [Acetobacter sp.]